MEVIKGLHMKGGDGEGSYTKNSTGQMKAMLSVTSVIEKAVARICSNNKSMTRSIGIADFGCSTGTNSLMAISNTIRMIRSKTAELGIAMPEVRISLNDRLTNDFNYLFTSALPEFYDKMKREEGGDHCFVSCVAGSFHGRLLPKNSHHLFVSFTSLQWLSQPPSLGNLNKGNILISNTSPPCVSKAYHDQFNVDFSTFIRSRAEEIVSGGQMVLQFPGQASPDFSKQAFMIQSELLAQALVSLAAEGLVEEEKIDAFNCPIYTPCIDQVKGIVQDEGSFSIDYLEEGEYPFQINGEWIAKSCRAATELLLEAQFGAQIMDELFRRYAKLASDNDFSNSKFTYLIVSLTKT